MLMLNLHNMEIFHISATISAWKLCSISLYHNFCCSGSFCHLFNLYSFTCTGVQHHFRTWWHLRRLAVTRDKNLLPFRSTWSHPSVYWCSCSSICSFMCSIMDCFFLSICPISLWSVYWFETATSICEI